MLPRAMGYYRQDEASGWVSGEALSKEDKRGQKRKGTFSGVCGRGTLGSVAKEVTVVNMLESLGSILSTV